MTEPNFFGQGSPYLHHPLLTPERTAKEVDFLLAQLDLPPGARLLDIGCGPGRHCIELARRGYGVVGIDPSPAMISAARARAAETGVSPDFRQANGESFVADQEFGAALCLFTTLGQISQDGENRGLIKRAYNALRPGGSFVVETPQRDWAVRHLKPVERFGKGEIYTDVSRSYDSEQQTITELFEVVAPGNTRAYLLRYRLFSQTELSDLVTEAGFTIHASFGDYEGNPLDANSAVTLLIARR